MSKKLFIMVSMFPLIIGCIVLATYRAPTAAVTYLIHSPTLGNVPPCTGVAANSSGGGEGWRGESAKEQDHGEPCRDHAQGRPTAGKRYSLAIFSIYDHPTSIRFALEPVR